MKKKSLLLCTSLLLAVVLLVAGCGGSGGSRISGLSPEGVVQTFVDLAKQNNMNTAGLYISPDTASNPSSAWQYLSGQTDLSNLKNANLLSVKKVAEQGDFAVVVATLQPQQNNVNVVVKPVGLQKIDGEWYIVDNTTIYQSAKYAILQQLFKLI